MLWKLTALRFRGAFDRQAIRGRKKAMAVLTAVLLIYLAVCICGLMYLMFSALCLPFSQLGLDWFYFGLAGLMAFSLAFVCTIFSAQAQLYEARDNELLLALPIAPGVILASRMLYLWLMDFLGILLVLLPAAVVYGLQVGMTAFQALCLALVCLALPGLSLACAALAGYGTAALTSRLGRFKSLFTMLLSVAFLGVYFYFYSQVQRLLAALLTNAQALADGARRVFPLFHLGQAIAGSSLISLAVTLAVCLIPLLLTWALLSRSFVRIATRRRGAPKVHYRAGSLRTSSLRRALLGRELRRLAASPVYMMNSGIGVILLLIMTVAAAVKRDALAPLLSLLPVSGAALAALALCGISSTILFTAPSVSLEGKTLWLLQSLPVKPREILRAKLLLHLMLSVPAAVVCAPILCRIFGATGAQWLTVALVCAAYNWYTASLGLVMNLLFPKLDWISETVAVKQGVSVLLSMLGSMVLVALAVGCWALGAPETILLPGFAALCLLASLLLTRWIYTRGAARFAVL